MLYKIGINRWCLVYRQLYFCFFAKQSILSNNLLDSMQTIYHFGVSLDAPNNLVKALQGCTILPGPYQIGTRLTPSSLAIPCDSITRHFGRSLPNLLTRQGNHNALLLMDVKFVLNAFVRGLDGSMIVNGYSHLSGQSLDSLC
jgi:hypothetical protein